MKLKQAMRASTCEAKRRRSSSSHSRVAKKLSHRALSYASPTEPIEGRTPASLQRLPKANEVYWAESNGRRNTWRKGLRWALGSGARIGPGEVSYGRRVGQGGRGVRTGGGSGRRSRRAWRVRTPRAGRVYRRR